MTDVLVRLVEKTAAAWTSANTVLTADEIGVESDTGYEKQGDGSTAWTSLAYLPSVAPPGNPDPSWNGYAAWTFDPLLAAGGGIALTSGVLLVAKMRMTQSKALATITARVNTAGSSLTLGQCFAAVLDSTGSQIGITADQSAVWNSTGDKAMALTAPTAVQKIGSFIYGVLLSWGTPNPAFRSETGSANPNVGLAAASGLRFGTSGTGLTTPGSVSLAGVAASATQLPWIAVS